MRRCEPPDGRNREPQRRVQLDLAGTKAERSRTRTVEARGHSVTRQGQRGRGDDDERRWDSSEEKRHGGAARSDRDEGAERLHTQGGKRWLIGGQKK